MSWWQVLIGWLLFQGQLGGLPGGGSVTSPPIIISYADGRRFEVVLTATRTQ